jgi:hypothetical protein
MSMVTVGIIGMGSSLLSGFIGGSRAKKAARTAAREKKRLAAELKTLEQNRQEISNPYAGFENLSGMASDLSGMATNTFANLGVATQAAEIQMEQADLALANSLDTIRATGAGAGGATALAQAALESKKGVSASIEQQEAQNQKLVAQGEERLEGIRMSEGQRMQSIGLSEGQRMQQSEAAGIEYTQGITENRQNAEIDRVAGQMGLAAQAQNQARADETNAITGTIGAMGQMAQAVASYKAPTPTTTGVTTESDRRLKNNIKLISKSKSGLNIYSFNYKDDKTWGKETYQGVMSDEIPQKAVVKHEDGFDRVDYSKIDVEFKLI